MPWAWPHGRPHPCRCGYANNAHGRSLGCGSTLGWSFRTCRRWSVLVPKPILNNFWPRNTTSSTSGRSLEPFYFFFIYLFIYLFIINIIIIIIINFFYLFFIFIFIFYMIVYLTDRISLYLINVTILFIILIFNIYLHCFSGVKPWLP